jgi:hypothetical protein
MVQIQIDDMPRNPGRYYLYLVRPDKQAVQIGEEFGSSVKAEWAESGELEAFWVVVSTEPGRAEMEPDGEDVLMISIAP